MVEGWRVGVKGERKVRERGRQKRKRDKIDINQVE